MQIPNMTSAMFAIYCNLWSCWPIFERWWQNMTPYQWSNGQALSSLVKGCEGTAHNHRISSSLQEFGFIPTRPNPQTREVNAAWCNALLRSRADLLDTLSTGCSQGCTSEESLIEGVWLRVPPYQTLSWFLCRVQSSIKAPDALFM